MKWIAPPCLALFLSITSVLAALTPEQAEMDALKAKIGSDPTLQKADEGTIFWSKAVSFPLGILMGD